MIKDNKVLVSSLEHEYNLDQLIATENRFPAL